MGIAGISAAQLLIVLVIAVLLFGSSKVRSLGSDLGKAIRGFKQEVKGLDEPNEEQRNSMIDN